MRTRLSFKVATATLAIAALFSANVNAASAAIPPAATPTLTATDTTIPLAGCGTSTLTMGFATRAETDPTTYSIYVTAPGVGYLAKTASVTGTTATDTITFCHGTAKAGTYTIEVSADTDTHVGTTLLSGGSDESATITVGADVTPANLTVTNSEIAQPETCGDTTITVSQPDLQTDEPWNFRLLILYPGAGYWREAGSASGTGPFSRDVGLYLCPTDPSGVYSISADYTVTDVSGTISHAQTVSAAVIVDDPIEITTASAAVVTAQKKTTKVAVSAVRKGSKVKVHGTVKSGKKFAKGTKAKLQKMVHGKWRTVDTDTTSKTGGVTFQVKAAPQAKLRVVVVPTAASYGTISIPIRK